jgi:hypothetical protein
MTDRQFPYVPKSSKSLELGDFWSIPIDGSRFACGRVIGTWPPGWKGSQRGFFAGLLDWVSDSVPTATSIAGAALLMQGGAHIKTIIATGGAISGNRPLELDGITPGLSIEHPDRGEPYVFRGMEQIRPASAKELETLPMLSFFGFQAMQEFANHHFRQGV